MAGAGILSTGALTHVAWFLLAVASGYSLAAIAGWLIRTSTRFAPALGIGAACVLMACPLWIPRDQVALRAIAMVIVGEMIFKVLDFSRHVRAHGPVSAREFYHFLVPFPPMLVVLAKKKRYHPRDQVRWTHIGEIALAAMCLALAFPVLQATADSSRVRSSFLLDHTIKLVLFIVVLESFSRLFYRLERFTGYDTKPPMQFFFLSRTVAEFWRRYNNRVHDWFYHNVFRSPRARRAPLLAVVAVFFVSGLFHEIGFGVATSRVDGYQMTFFMLQIPAVVASVPLERWARRSGVGSKTVVHGLAILWIAATSIFFFHGVDRVFPFFYTSQPWLP